MALLGAVPSVSAQAHGSAVVGRNGCCPPHSDCRVRSPLACCPPCTFQGSVFTCRCSPTSLPPPRHSCWSESSAMLSGSMPRWRSLGQVVPNGGGSWAPVVLHCVHRSASLFLSSQSTGVLRAALRHSSCSEPLRLVGKRGPSPTGGSRRSFGSCPGTHSGELRLPRVINRRGGLHSYDGGGISSRLHHVSGSVLHLRWGRSSRGHKGSENC